MTTQPSIESLNRIVDYIWPGLEHWKPLSDAIKELSALRESDAALRAENARLVAERDGIIVSGTREAESLRALLKDRQGDIMRYQNRIEDLEAEQDSLCTQLTAERARADGLAARVEALRGVLVLVAEGEPGTIQREPCRHCGGGHGEDEDGIEIAFAHERGCPVLLALKSIPSADLEAHDARVRREEREGFRCAPDGYVHCVEAPPDLRPLAEEMVRARTKFPGPRVLGSALAEEVGEMADAWLRMDPTHCRKEALQVACVAMRIHQEGNVGIGESMEILKLMAALEAPARAYLGATGLGPDTSAPEAREDSPRHANGHAASCPFDGMGSAGFMECTCGGPEAQDNGQEGK